MPICAFYNSVRQTHLKNKEIAFVPRCYLSTCGRDLCRSCSLPQQCHYICEVSESGL
ncbi:hypothetical protein B0H12DRAFT_1115404 [Mycena haematopus]|nr:hypothetical protein B0H12DRAFT_1115404 [Mycena haematopus]